MKIVSLSGLDGSGKSTQIELLKSYLQNQGRKVFYFHAIEFGLANKISAFFREHCLICKLFKKCSMPKKEKSMTKAGKIGIILRKIFLGIDLRRFKKLYKKLEKEGFDYIISDRYFYDSVINIEYLNNIFLPLEKGELERDFKDYKSPPTPLLQRGILTPDIAIHLETSPENIMRREQKPDQGLEYLQAKKILYDAMTPLWNLRAIDGNRNKEEIFEEIRKLV